MAEFYSNWQYTVGNVIVLLIVAMIGWLAWRASGKEYWRDATRRVFASKRAIVCFAVLVFYVTVALLDSVAWRDVSRDEDGNVVKSPDGERILEPNATTLLDRIDAATLKFGVRSEKTFSGPFASESFTKETTQDDAGNTVRRNAPLDHPGKHPLGTDKVGDDVLWKSLKGIRTALVIGGFTTLLVLPFALFFGTVAGYFGKWIDDAISYIYSTLASIPSILLIAAFMLIFGRGLFQLCLIMAVTSWTGLCRVIRGESLKLRELEYVQAAQALGVSSWKILAQHLTPNVMHIVLISSILRFSGLVLSEALLSYLNIGVGPSTASWGSMINDARFELAREPVVWWNLVAAFVFMFGLVLPANIFGDAVRDALDPRLRTG